MKKSKWKMKEQADFLYKLGELLENGYPLSGAIQFLQLQVSKKKMLLLDDALNLLRRGHPLNYVLGTMYFHPQLISYVYYAEQYGNLSLALKEGGGFWNRRSHDLEKLKKLLIYPVFLLFFVAVVFYVLQGMLLPKFEVLFDSMDADENVFLTIVLNISAILPYIPYLFGLGMLSFLLARQIWLKKMCPLMQRKLLMNIPLIGTFFKLYETHFFASQFSGLLTGGLSINESIKLFSTNHQQPFYQKLSAVIRRDLSEGKPFEEILKELPYFDNHLAIIVANGQKYGRLDKELFHYSRYLLERMEEKMLGLMKFIQPVLFAIVGGLVVSIYLAVLMPMFSLLNGI